MLNSPEYPQLRDVITNAYRINETDCLTHLLTAAQLPPESLARIIKVAHQLVNETREYKKRQGKLDTLLHQYDLSTEEGIALMCLAEALLRIPDTATRDKFISDKLSTAEWENHLTGDNPLFVNAATWSLLLTGKIYAPTLDQNKSFASSLKRAASRIGVTVIRPFLMQMMKAIGNQFVLGQTIEEALKRASEQEQKGYRFSYDMLGEAARTTSTAKHYYDAYAAAIDAIGKVANPNQTPAQNPGISIKLSALHPRYDYTQRELILKELPPLLLTRAR